MNELNTKEQNNLEESAKNQTEKCSEAQAVDAESIPLELEERELREKIVRWPEAVAVGDCTIWNMMCSFWSDGKARFNADVRSSDSGDVWVFRGGISILDNNGTVLWTSGRLVGPEMPEDQTTNWNQVFFFPAVFWESIAKARINRMHC